MLFCSPQKRRRPTLGVQLDDKRKEMLKRHPLSVTIDLKCKGKLVLVTLGTEGCESRSRSNLPQLSAGRVLTGLQRAAVPCCLCRAAEECVSLPTGSSEYRVLQARA